MKLYLKILFIGVLALVLLTACSKDKKESGNPASASGVTGANGQTTLTLGSYNINVTVENADHAGVSNIDINGYLTHNSILLEAFDSTGTYYPSITLVPLGVSLGRRGQQDRINSPEEIADASLEATLILYPVQWGVLGLDNGTGYDEVVADEWTTEQWQDGQLADMYNIVDTVSLFQHGVFVHLKQSVKLASGAQYGTAVFLPGQISNSAAFSSLVGVVFSLFEGDSLHFCQLNYSGAPLPIIHVDNIIMHRDFWAQFTLGWAHIPYDQDSHLWTPPMGIDSARYHICYYGLGAVNVPPYDTLDVDDRNGDGPEHLTIYRAVPGIYTYAVHDFSSGDGLITSSNATVNLLKPDGAIQTFNVPTDSTGVQERWWWIVCTIDGTTGTVTPINRLSALPPYTSALKTEPAKQ